MYTYTYDQLSRPQTVENPAGKMITYGYDAAGQKELLIDPDGGRFTYNYDDAGRMESLVNPDSDRTTYSYDAADRETLKELANATRAEFSYDDADRLTVLANLKSDDSVIAKFTYTYDNTGNRTTALENDGALTTWTYDDAYQLRNATRTGVAAYNNTMTYDAVGNRLTKVNSFGTTAYTYNAANELQTSVDSTGTTTYTYDAAGNQQTVETPAGAVTTNVWDDESQRITVRLPSGVDNTSVYNGEGQRVENQHGAAGAVKFIWNEGDLLAETNSAGVTQTLYTRSPALSLISRRSTAADYFHFNGLGSTVNFTDSSEIVVDTYIFDDFGTIIDHSSVSGSVPDPLFLWMADLGYTYDWDIEQYYENGLIYDPSQSRYVNWPSQEGQHGLQGIDELQFVAFQGQSSVGGATFHFCPTERDFQRLLKWCTIIGGRRSTPLTFNQKEFDRLIVDLGDNTFSTREHAMHQLLAMGPYLPPAAINVLKNWQLQRDPEVEWRMRVLYRRLFLEIDYNRCHPNDLNCTDCCAFEFRKDLQRCVNRYGLGTVRYVTCKVLATRSHRACFTQCTAMFFAVCSPEQEEHTSSVLD